MTEKIKITSNDITKHLLRWAASNNSEIVVPNYYICRWECDVLKISKSGHLYEYEVKVSRADFKNDIKKRTYFFSELKNETKHDHIRNGKRVNRFYFVVPEGLVTPDEVPPGFGLIYVKAFKYKDLRESEFSQTHFDFSIVKVSKLLKKEPCKTDLYIHIAQNLSMKLANAKAKL